MRVKPRAQVEAALRERAEEERAVSPEPELHNIQPALYLTGPLRIPFRGRMWSAHVNFDDGVRAYRAYRAMQEAAETDDVDRATEAVRETERVARRVLRRYPERWWQKLLRVTGLRRSPVRDWTEREVIDLLAFFLMCRTTSRVGGSSIPANRETSTSSTSSPSSSMRFRPGVTNGASR